MQNYSSTPRTSPETNALREEAWRLAVPSAETNYARYDRAHAVGEMFLSLEGDSRYAATPQQGNSVESQTSTTSLPTGPERQTMRRAEQSLGIEVSHRTLEIGRWMQYARQAEQTRSS